MTKADLLAALADANEQFDTAIAGLDEAALVESGVVGQWSIKDLIGHVTAWEQLAVEALEQARSGEPIPAPSWASADEYNAQDAARKSGWTLAEVRADAAETRRRLLALLADLTEEDWMTPVASGDREQPLGDWISGALNGDNEPGTHAAEHARQIGAWRTRRESTTGR